MRESLALRAMLSERYRSTVAQENPGKSRSPPTTFIVHIYRVMASDARTAARISDRNGDVCEDRGQCVFREKSRMLQNIYLVKTVVIKFTSTTTRATTRNERYGES